VGLMTPIAGLVHRGQLYPARHAWECKPLSRGSPGRNCSIAGAWPGRKWGGGGGRG
jgi:hypothetical protein